MVFKASEKSPLGAIALGEYIKEAGFPPGVINIVSGGGKTGSLLAAHMKIYKISFTGSIASGRKVQDAATKSNLKAVTLERKSALEFSCKVRHLLIVLACHSRWQVASYCLQRCESRECTCDELTGLPHKHRPNLRSVQPYLSAREDRTRLPERTEGEIRKHVQRHGRHS